MPARGKHVPKFFPLGVFREVETHQRNAASDVHHLATFNLTVSCISSIA
jgi:hypothetical protein